MGDDLVKRLRWRHVHPESLYKPVDHLYEEAAERIEALEAENKQMLEALEHLDAGDGWAAQVARTVLAKISATPHEWYYPCGYESPPPAPPGMTYEIEYDNFLGLENRWRLVPSTTSEGEE